MGIILSVLLFVAGFAGTPSPQTPASPAAEAFAVFQKHCLGCHGDNGYARTALHLDRAALVTTGKVLPGRAEDSILFKRLTGAIEPLMPDGGPKLPDAEIAAIRRWINEGAPDWKPASNEPRRLISNSDVISAIEQDLLTRGADTSRRYFRYFVLTNLYNAGDTKLATYRLALYKLLNSLSWDRDLTLPTIIDKEETILRIDIREYDWSDPSSTWETILAGYPYGVETSSPAFFRIQSLTSTGMPFIRADWFVAAASMPPLYHEILELPESEAALETCSNGATRCLRIDTDRNLRESPGLRVVRAGFTESGVSNSNRIVERHRSPYGAYWKSHDFPDNVGEHNIFKHPLDFQRAGGEIIFNLPNGLQAYLLVDATGKRIDQGPTNIVFNKRGSRAEIRNGVSCMTCHASGMRPVTDDVRASLPAFPEHERSYALSLYAEADVLRKLVQEDQERFETALRRIGIPSGVEPIADLTDRYSSSVNAKIAASELGMTPEAFLRHLSSSDTLRQLGLGALLSGGVFKRDAWEDIFGDVVEELRSGDYIRQSRIYGERFFSDPAPPLPGRPGNPIRTGFIESITSGLLGRTVRTVEAGRDRTYSVRDVRFLTDCSVEIVDITRLADRNSPQSWWQEEDTQSFSLQTVLATMGREGPVDRLRVFGNTAAPIRLVRSFTSGPLWNDASLLRTGTTTEFVDTVQFDLPPDAQTARMFESLTSAITRCSSRSPVRGR
jgi:mono/diheme cytochrome c family protein